MSDSSDLNNYVRRHREELARRFREPDVAAFERVYRCKMPSLLARLYDLREGLMHTPIEVSAERARLWIECFSPLTLDSIAWCERYDWRFFQFASGGEGQAFLVAPENPTNVFIDFEENDSDVEELSVDFPILVAELCKRLQK